MENEVKEIMFDKLREMSELSHTDFMPEDMAAYNGLCSVMNDIAKTLLE